MKQYIQIRHNLPSFSVTKDLIETKSLAGRNVVIIEGKVTTSLQTTCSNCGSKILHKHQHHKIRLQHSSILGKISYIDVNYIRCKCPKCNKIYKQEIPFKAPNHRMTKFFVQQVKGYLQTGFTLNDVSHVLAVHPNIAKSIDKHRLKQKLGNMKPKRYSKYTAVDGFC